MAGVDRRSKSRLDSEVLGVHVCYSILEMVLVWMTMHFVEVGFVLVGFRWQE